MTRMSGRQFRAAVVGLVVALFAPAAYADGPMSGFRGTDANHDGKVTPDEHAAAAKKMFDTMDADKDGTVTAAELAAGHAKMMKKAPK